MIRVWMTEDHVIDGRESGCNQFQICEHSVVGISPLIVVRSRVVDQCEIGTTHQHTKTGAHIYNVDGEGWHRWCGWRRRWRHDRNHPCPTLRVQTRSKPFANRTSCQFGTEPISSACCPDVKLPTCAL